MTDHSTRTSPRPSAPNQIQIAIDEIRPRIGRESEVADPEGVERLYNSYLAVGRQMVPIGVDSEYRLVYGLYRLEAARRAGWVTVDAIVVADASCDPHEHRFLALQENVKTAPQPAQLREFVRMDLEPALEARTAANRRAGGLKTAAERWGSAVGVGKFPTPIDSSESADAGVAVGNFPTAISAVLAQPGPTSEVVKSLLPGVSFKSVQKMLKIEDIANDETKPESVRKIARDELAKLDEDGKYDRHFKVVEAALAVVHEPADDRVERERAITFTKVLAPLSQAETAVSRLTPAVVEDVLKNYAAGTDDLEAAILIATNIRDALISLRPAGLVSAA